MSTKRFSCSLHNLEKIGDYISDFASHSGLNAVEAYAVQLAVDEAATNIIEHGYGGECPNRIDVTCEILPDGLKVVIYDDAAPFDPSVVPDPQINVALDELKMRGLGIFLMRKMMDEVTFESSPDKGNTLTMVKHHKP